MKIFSILFISILILSSCTEKEKDAVELTPEQIKKEQKESFEKATKYTEPTKPARGF